MTVTPDTLSFSAAADSQQVVVNTNVITTAEPQNAIWVSADPEWMDESTTVTIKVRENSGTDTRTAIVLIKSEALQHDLIVIQEGAPADSTGV